MKIVGRTRKLRGEWFSNNGVLILRIESERDPAEWVHIEFTPAELRAQLAQYEAEYDAPVPAGWDHA